MIDNTAIVLFGMLIVYTVFRAIKLDKLIPWFTNQDQASSLSSKKDMHD